MALPGVGVFPGENPEFIVQHLRKAGFPVKAVWAQTEKQAIEVKKKLNLPYVTTSIRELVLHTEVDLVIIDSPPPTHQQICANALGIGKHVLCTLPGGLNMRDTRKMFDAASYYPQLLAAALNPVRFIEQIVKLRNFIKSSAGQVYMVEAKMKSKAQSKEHWKTDHRMAMLGWKITKNREQSLFTHSEGTIFLLEIEIVLLDSSLNITSTPGYLLESMHPRTESVIEIRPASQMCDESAEDHADHTNESENADSVSPEKDVKNNKTEETSGEADEEVKKTFAESGAQTIAIETQDAAAETSNGNIQLLSDRESLVKMGLPKLLEAVKERDEGILVNASEKEILRYLSSPRKDSFLTGGMDSRSWNETAINDSPIGKFSDILYVQGVLDALRRSDKSGEVEGVEMGDELKLEQLHFQAEFGTYVETVDHLQI
ncbi:Oidioi.mRNA.OKI2018_I69.chr2.g8339.t1.cds [Oikopleura dioica]|uniref:Oidioi.mRNA.OKI2018_I69.chr2.g8339.t1.cds n=1 Tax=Oikopleura dioica TaxID=34765 RepID=A0ABN7TFB9_OIKDI|nr:Oidioi.mRNA.OKI2018_I69.chr2.g8339.t1.cds [Oikopleura dioica]